MSENRRGFASLVEATADVIYGSPFRKFFAGLTLAAVSTITYASVWRGAENAEILKQATEMDRHHSDRHIAEKSSIKMFRLCNEFAVLRVRHLDLHTFVTTEGPFWISVNEDLNDWLARLDRVRQDTAVLVAEFKEFRSEVEIPQFEAPEAKTAQEFQKQHSDWHLQRLALYQARQAVWFRKKEPDSRDSQDPLKKGYVQADEANKKLEDERREEHKRRFDGWNRTHNHNSAALAGRRESLWFQDTYSSIASIYLVGWGIFALAGIARRMRPPKAEPDVGRRRRRRRVGSETTPSSANDNGE